METFGHVHVHTQWVLILISNITTMKIKSIFFGLGLLLLTSCLGDLDVKPLDPNINTADKVYADQNNYSRNLLKIYSVLAMSGQDGEGSSDLEGLDAGNTQFYRSLWNLQVASTDECINSWPDPWVPEVMEMKWTPVGNESIEGVYHRAMYMVAISNEYLVQTTDAYMAERGIEESFWPTVHQYRYEARFLRALAYVYLMDMYGNPPFITESNYSSEPSQIGRAELFNWIEKELTDIKDELVEAKTAGFYGRADQGVVNALLSRMYLNAEVYTGKPMYDKCVAISKEIIDMPVYGLADTYADLFKADNDRSDVAKEFIFPIVYEGTKTQTFGGIRFLIAASRGDGEVSEEIDGFKGGWSGNRALPNLVNRFTYSDQSNPTAESINDKRGIFMDKNRSIDIQTTYVKTFETEGWAVYKFTNMRSDGLPGTNPDSPDTDIPLIRLPEIYLNYAEAVVRGGGGSKAEAVRLINMLRERAYGHDKAAITEADMTVDFLLEERSRELYWEGTRRTDLVRYGNFTSGSYLWQYKGGVKLGTGVETYKNVYPIPSSDLSVNGNLKQNIGY